MLGRSQHFRYVYNLRFIYDTYYYYFYIDTLKI